LCADGDELAVSKREFSNGILIWGSHRGVDESLSFLNYPEVGGRKLPRNVVYR